MSKDNNPQIVTIDDVEYKISDLTEKQIVILNHVTDLDRKLANTRFQLDQLQVGRDAFFIMLKQELAAPKEIPTVSE